ncbi:MAG: YqeG family HAD IIIA-type phosphatase [Candidatus Fimenecus sp.]
MAGNYKKSILDIFIPSSPMPRYRFKSVLDITPDDLQKMGAKAVALDIDNTICNDGKDNCIEGLESWISKIQGAGIKMMIISNAIEPRPGKIAKSLGLPYLCFAKKPLSYKLRRGAKMMGVDISEMAMVGDQLFADIKAANSCGAIGVRVDPLMGETRYPHYYARRRKKEAAVLEEFEKLHGYGVYDE